MRKVTVALTVLALLIAACGSTPTESPDSIKLLSHDSFVEAVTEETFGPFTTETGIAVEVIAGGDAGSMVNQAILSKDNPLADVLFGVDDTFLSRTLDEDIFIAHGAEGIDTVDPDLLDPEHRVTPIDFGDVCINYDKAWFEQSSIEVPDELNDFRSGEYASRLTVEHPATSSPGLAFMFATIDEFGEDGWLDFWSDLEEQGVNVAADWNSAYYGDFTRYDGDSPMVVSYASSPPAEVIFAEEPLEAAPTGVIEAGCYRQVEYAGVLAGTEYPETAGALIDYMLSIQFQEQVPLSWFVFPANSEASLPQEFVEHTVIPESPTRFSGSYIAENRDRWLAEWIRVMEG